MADPYRPAHSAARRFRLDPEAARSAATRQALQRFGLVLAFLAVLEVSQQLAARQVWPSLVWAIVSVPLLALFAVSVWRARRAAGSSDLELLLSARVLYRNTQGRVAEILRPEVTDIVRTPLGIWVTSTTPRRSLFVSRAFDGFADVEESLRAWRPLRELRGWAAVRHASRAARSEGPRDAVLGTALATDASLPAELDAVRAASLVARAHPVPVVPRARKGWTVLALWGLLIVMFLAIWQVLQPAERHHATTEAPSCDSQCTYAGECKMVDSKCVADSTEHCLRSEVCANEGLCSYGVGRCVAATDADCKLSHGCLQSGTCKAGGGTCFAGADRECKESVDCRETGLCKAVDGKCIAGSDGDCKGSLGCKTKGLCKAVDGECATK
jgi:hypothetical protein